jgi:hypothetical protein
MIYSTADIDTAQQQKSGNAAFFKLRVHFCRLLSCRLDIFKSSVIEPTRFSLYRENIDRTVARDE